MVRRLVFIEDATDKDIADWQRGDHPDRPIHHPGHPDHGLPAGPPAHASDQPVPPGQPAKPAQPIYHPGHPDHGLPVPPAHVSGQPVPQPGHPDASLPPRQPGSPPPVAGQVPGATPAPKK